MDQQVKECRSAPFVTPKFLERRSALPLTICWSYGAALLVLERLPKSAGDSNFIGGTNIEVAVWVRMLAVSGDQV